MNQPATHPRLPIGKIIGMPDVAPDSDQEGPLQGLARVIDAVNEEKGWNEGIEHRTPGDWAALNHSEISEALEAFRNGEPLVWLDHDKGGKPEGEAVEYVDVIYRVLHWFAQKKIDPDKVMALKLEYNRNRPYRHGNKQL